VSLESLAGKEGGEPLGLNIQKDAYLANDRGGKKRFDRKKPSISCHSFQKEERSDSEGGRSGLQRRREKALLLQKKQTAEVGGILRKRRPGLSPKGIEEGGNRGPVLYQAP